MDLPTSVDQLTPDWLGHALGVPPSRLRVTRRVRVGEGLGLSGTVVLLEVEGHDVRRIVAKLSGAAGGGRERAFFEELAPRAGIPLPVYLAGSVDEAVDRSALLFEYLEDARQGDVLDGCSPGEAMSLARILAALHARWWDADDLCGRDWLRPTGWELSDPSGPAPARLDRFLAAHGDRMSAPMRRLAEDLPSRAPAVSDELGREPHTLLHNDFHLDNVMFRPDGSPVVLDWQSVGRGPAATDVARLLAECMRPDVLRTHRDEVLSAYLDGLRERGVPGLTRESLDRSVHLCLIRLFSGLIGWMGAEPAAPPHPRVPKLQLNLLENLTVALE